MRSVLILLLVAACNTPGPSFRDVAATRVTIAGSTFDVRLRDDLGEAIRVNAQFAPRLGPVADRARVAFKLVSGCEVGKLKGDQAYLIAELNCGAKARRHTASTVYRDFECLETARFTRPSTDEVVRELECTPIR